MTMNERTFDPETAAYVSLATFRRNGKEVRTPVWIAGSGGRYYGFSAGNAGKVKRIRANPRIRLAACDAAGRVRSPWGATGTVPRVSRTNPRSSRVPTSCCAGNTAGVCRCSISSRA